MLPEDEENKMSLLRKFVLALCVLLFSSVAVAYDSEREYLLDLYYGNDLDANQMVDQAEQSVEEDLANLENKPVALSASFPIADNN